MENPSRDSKGRFIKGYISPIKGISITPEQNSGLFKKGHKPFYANLGKKFSEETKRKISLGGIGKHIGEKNGMWKDGSSRIEKKIRGMSEYIYWREEVFKRDNYICVECGYKGYVTAHHKKSFILILKENNIKTQEHARECGELWDRSNGITLCEECHSKIDHYRPKRGKLK